MNMHVHRMTQVFRPAIKTLSLKFGKVDDYFSTKIADQKCMNSLYSYLLCVRDVRIWRCLFPPFAACPPSDTQQAICSVPRSFTLPARGLSGQPPNSGSSCYMLQLLLLYQYFCSALIPTYQATEFRINNVQSHNMRLRVLRILGRSWDLRCE